MQKQSGMLLHAFGGIDSKYIIEYNCYRFKRYVSTIDMGECEPSRTILE